MYLIGAEQIIFEFCHAFADYLKWNFTKMFCFP